MQQLFHNPQVAGPFSNSDAYIQPESPQNPSNVLTVGIDLFPTLQGRNRARLSERKRPNQHIIR